MRRLFRSLIIIKIMKWEDSLYCITSIGSFILYSIFMIYVTWILHSKKQKLDGYMKATVALIGISNLFLVWKSADIILGTKSILINNFDFSEMP